MQLFVILAVLLLSSSCGFSIIECTAVHQIQSTVESVSTLLSQKLLLNNDVALNPLDAYIDMLAANPLPTKMLTGATLATAGDAIAQSKTNERYDIRRATSFATFDMVYRAVQHFSFPAITTTCKGQYLSGLIASIPVLAQVSDGYGWENPSQYYSAVEQTLASQLGIVPFFYYPVFYFVTAYVQGLNFNAAVQRAKTTFVPLMKRNLLFWIPVQYVQFALIDENLQIPFLSLCGLCWTFIISTFAGDAKAKQHHEKEMDDSRYSLNFRGMNIEKKNRFQVDVKLKHDTEYSRAVPSPKKIEDYVSKK